jgi:DNA invertase Pin-like site-specific DNA recombinase
MKTKPAAEPGAARSRVQPSGATRRGRSAASGSPRAQCRPVLIGYVRVSTRDQGGNGHGLDAQRRTIERYCRDNGYVLACIIPDVVSTRLADKMYGRQAAVVAVEAGLADGIIVSTLDRASRSTLDGAILLDQARRQGWRLLSVDGVDSDDPEQTLLTDIRLAVAQEERRKISERTKAGLEAARAKGKQLGRPSKVTPALARRIVRLRMKDGLSAQKIAANLTTKKVPAPGGGATWHHSTVRLILAREGAA